MWRMPATTVSSNSPSLRLLLRPGKRRSGRRRSGKATAPGLARRLPQTTAASCQQPGLRQHPRVARGAGNVWCEIAGLAGHIGGGEPSPQPLSRCAGEGLSALHPCVPRWTRRCWPHLHRSCPLALCTGRGVWSEGSSAQTRPAKLYRTGQSRQTRDAVRRSRTWRLFRLHTAAGTRYRLTRPCSVCSPQEAWRDCQRAPEQGSQRQGCAGYPGSQACS
jgi:hypothetical protein